MPLRAMSMKSALRIYLSASYVMKSITSISHLRWLSPLWCLTAPPSPRGIGRATKGKRLYGQARRLTSPDLHILCRMCTVDNKALKSSLFICDSTVSTGYSAPACGGSPAKRARGNAFPTPIRRLYGFRRQRQHKKWRLWRRTSPAQRYYITPEGESPQPACKAKPITGRTLAAQGQRPGGWLNPHARKGVSTFGNTGKRRPADWYLPTFESLAIFTARILHRMRESAKVGP